MKWTKNNEKKVKQKKVIAVAIVYNMHTVCLCRYYTELLTRQPLLLTRGRRRWSRAGYCADGGCRVARWELRKSGIIISFLIIQDRSETLIKSVTNKNTAPTPRLDGHFAAICHSKGANLAPAKHLPSTPPIL